MAADLTDPAAILADLIRCPSVTPAEGGALDLLERLISPLDFACARAPFGQGAECIDNLYARFGEADPHLMFAGHTDVVPVGDAEAWTHPPFAAEIAGGAMYGRGAVDMKGGIACFVAAFARHVAAHGAPQGAVSLLITGDEEGVAVNGTAKVLEWAAARGERWDGAIVGEPTNPEAIGDMIKIGRRGSVNARITVFGKQGHVAYPHRAQNPVRGLLRLAAALLDEPFDGGSDDFQPSNLEITSIDVGNPATNVIPAQAEAAFNIRFNDHWSAETVKGEILRRLDAAAAGVVRYEIAWAERPSHVFLTRDERLIDTLSSAVAAVTGRAPQLSTSGGTSDARFIKDYCPVVEFGLVGKTMHAVDECVALDDLEILTRIYERFLAEWFGKTV